MRFARPLAVLLTALLSTAPAGGCDRDGPGDRYSGRIFSMGTSFEIAVRLTAGVDSAAAARAVEEAFGTIAHLDSLLSTYLPESDISHINGGAGGGHVGVDPLVVAVLDSSLYYWELTGGAFDVTVGPLLELWGFRGGEPKVPGSGELAAALDLVGSSGLDLDPEGSSARLRRRGQKVDLGGIGKGFALDEAARALRSGGVSHAVLNSGGNLLFMGEASEGEPWKAGIAHPRSPGEVIAAFEASEVAVSTSGDYERFFVSDGVRYPHILDPRTGRPAAELSSVTVIAPSATGADALSTALVVLGAAEGMDLVESLPGVEAAIVEAPGGASGVLHLSVSSGLAGRMEPKGEARLLTSPPAAVK